MPRGLTATAPDLAIPRLPGANDCVVVTGNEKDFADVEIVNPLSQR
jgi:hypothetical protein